MAGITRTTAAIFSTTGLTGTGGFGSAANGTPTTEAGSSNTIANIQTGVAGAWASGWASAVLGASKFPAIEDMNAVFNVTTSQIAYILERGIAEYDAGTSYNIGDICKGAATSVIYKSITNANLGNATSNATYWTTCGDLTNLPTSALGVLAYLNEGGGVTTDGSGNAFVSLAGSTTTGASHTYATADGNQVLKRSNSGSAMTDTLPGTSGALQNGWFTYVKNTDTTAQITVAVGAGGIINNGISTGSFVISPGEIWLIESQGTGVYTVARIAANKPQTTGHSEFTGSGTFTTPINAISTSVFKFIITGAGGGGGANNNNPGVGGAGAGSTAIYFASGLAANTGYTVTVGAGGTGGAGSGASGTNGGNSSVVLGATTVTAPGGNGSASTATGGAAGGGACTNATISIKGGDGSAASGSGLITCGGNGGASYWGGGGAGAQGNSGPAGGVGEAYGSGGGGGVQTSQAGGTGAGGIVTVEWVI